MHLRARLEGTRPIGEPILDDFNEVLRLNAGNPVSTLDAMMMAEYPGFDVSLRVSSSPYSIPPLQLLTTRLCCVRKAFCNNVIPIN